MADMRHDDDRAITGAVTAIPAEDARVGLAVCQLCGAAILLDPREAFDAIELHRDWHERLSIATRTIPDDNSVL